ncbi:MAG: inositol monophosphatase family protein [Maricaulaceae bacterium]
MTEPVVEDFLDLAHALADAARAESLAQFRANPETADKNAGGDFDPVTLADKNAEAAMRALIREHAPDHGVRGEEFPETPARGPWRWTLDPIDGTRAYIAGFPLWVVLIALSYEGRPVLGVIDQPYLNERYVGVIPQKGPARAWLSRSGSPDRPLSVRPCAGLRDATLASTDPFLFEGGEAGAFEQVRQAAKLSRFGGDGYAYAMLALGGVDLVIESGLQPHDAQALIPVVEGAGGLLTNWRGGPAWEGGQVIAAGDHRAHEQALVALKRAAR